MYTPFNLDLKVQRRKAGLSQEDVAHLMGIHPSKVSLLEGGRAHPSLNDIAALSIVFGKSFEEFFFAFVQGTRIEIVSRLKSMPRAPKHWLPQFNRQYTIDNLTKRLADIDEDNEAS